MPTPSWQRLSDDREGFTVYCTESLLQKQVQDSLGIRFQ